MYYRKCTCSMMMGACSDLFIANFLRWAHCLVRCDHAFCYNSQLHVYCRILSVKVHPVTCRESIEGKKKYSSDFSLTSALDRGGWLTPRLATLYVRDRNSIPIVQGSWLGPRTGLSGVRKISPAPGFDHRIFYPVASRHTDYAIVANVIVVRASCCVALKNLFICPRLLWVCSNLCHIQGGSNMTGTNCDLFTHK